MVVVQPSKGFFLDRPGPAAVTIDVYCPGGGFGWASVPWPLDRRYQGKRRSFDVTADVRYPEGRGAMLRFKGGMQVGRAGRAPWKPAVACALCAVLTVPAAFCGVFILHRSARLKVRLPFGVRETIDGEPPILRRIERQVGDGARGKKAVATRKTADDPDF